LTEEPARARKETWLSDIHPDDIARNQQICTDALTDDTGFSKRSSGSDYPPAGIDGSSICSRCRRSLAPTIGESTPIYLQFNDQSSERTGMLGTKDLSLFIAAGLLLNITPGADTLYILGRSATQGFRGGLLAALGIGAGCLVHISAAALGLSALLAASATAFAAVKMIGAGYLLYLGLSLLMKRSGPQLAAGPMPRSSGIKIFWQGFLTNVLNPKVALFFLAFLPQFILIDAPNKSLAMLFLGVLFDFNGTLWNIFVAFAASSLSKRINHSRSISHWLNRTVGALFVYFGVRLAVSRG
jgi:threonine/homoserine/homoserine lactone efflux protein